MCSTFHTSTRVFEDEAARAEADRNKRARNKEGLVRDVPRASFLISSAPQPLEPRIVVPLTVIHHKTVEVCSATLCRCRRTHKHYGSTTARLALWHAAVYGSSLRPSECGRDKGPPGISDRLKKHSEVSHILGVCYEYNMQLACRASSATLHEYPSGANQNTEVVEKDRLLRHDTHMIAMQVSRGRDAATGS